MHIVDRQGSVILTLKSKTFSAHNKWYIFTGNSTDKADKIATVKPQSGTVTAQVLMLCYLKSAAAYDAAHDTLLVHTAIHDICISLTCRSCRV